MLTVMALLGITFLSFGQTANPKPSKTIPPKVELNKKVAASNENLKNKYAEKQSKKRDRLATKTPTANKEYKHQKKLDIETASNVNNQAVNANAVSANGNKKQPSHSGLASSLGKKENTNNKLNGGGVHLKADGSPDRRYIENKQK